MRELTVTYPRHMVFHESIFRIAQTQPPVETAVASAIKHILKLCCQSAWRQINVSPSSKSSGGNCNQFIVCGKRCVTHIPVYTNPGHIWPNVEIFFEKFKLMQITQRRGQ